jgi:hypothetical protein
VTLLLLTEDDLLAALQLAKVRMRAALPLNICHIMICQQVRLVLGFGNGY